MEPDAFEEMIARGREDIYRSVERAAASIAARKEKHQAIAAKAKAGLVLGNPGPFSLIYADPPWKWGHFGEFLAAARTAFVRAEIIPA
jgi:16S rRNA G966 N2-methylase RsmD